MRLQIVRRIDAHCGSNEIRQSGYLPFVKGVKLQALRIELSQPCIDLDRSVIETLLDPYDD